MVTQTPAVPVPSDTSGSAALPGAGGRDLPVAIRLDGVLAHEVSAFVESAAGWQVVGDGPPRPRLVLSGSVDAATPTAVLVEGAADPAVLRSALLAGAVDVIAWPDERDRLLDLPARLGAFRPPGATAPVLRITSAAGGAGASTVALAIGALLARRAPTVVVGGDDLLDLCGAAPWSGPGARELAGLHPDDARDEVTALARPVPGVRRLSVLGGGPAPIDCGPHPGFGVVVDGGTGTDGGLVVARPDAGLRRAARCSGPVLLCGDGPLDRAGVAALLGRLPIGRLPHDPRVARAAVRGRVPADLPGTWMAALAATASRWAQ